MLCFQYEIDSNDITEDYVIDNFTIISRTTMIIINYRRRIKMNAANNSTIFM